MISIATGWYWFTGTTWIPACPSSAAFKAALSTRRAVGLFFRISRHLIKRLRRRSYHLTRDQFGCRVSVDKLALTKQASPPQVYQEAPPCWQVPCFLPPQHHTCELRTTSPWPFFDLNIMNANVLFKSRVSVLIRRIMFHPYQWYGPSELSHNPHQSCQPWVQSAQRLHCPRQSMWRVNQRSVNILPLNHLEGKFTSRSPLDHKPYVGCVRRQRRILPPWL